jgi:hypothetical protein
VPDVIVWDFSRWDYAAIDTTACSDGNTGWFGYSIKTDQELTGITVYELAYPDRATCPPWTFGGDGSTAAGTDCPGTGSWPQSTWRLSGLPHSEPFTGAQLWQGSDNTVTVGDANPGQTIKTNIDITFGDSGGALDWRPINGGNYIVGVSSQQTDSFNIFNRFTTEVYNFLHAYSPFPQP